MLAGGAAHQHELEESKEGWEDEMEFVVAGLERKAAGKAEPCTGNVLKEGYLYKKKQKGLRMGVFNWQHRFCVLDLDAKAFTYGPHEGDSESRSIPFCELQRVQLSQDGNTGDASEEKHEDGGAGSGVQFEMRLTPSASNNNGSRVFVFRAQDPLDADEWVRVLRSVSLEATRERRLSAVLAHKVQVLDDMKDGGSHADRKSSAPKVQARPASPPPPAGFDEEAKNDPERGMARAVVSEALEELQRADPLSPRAAHFELEPAPLPAKVRRSDISDDSKNRLQALTDRLMRRARERRERTAAASRALTCAATFGSPCTPPDADGATAAAAAAATAAGSEAKPSSGSRQSRAAAAQAAASRFLRSLRPTRAGNNNDERDFNRPSADKLFAPCIRCICFKHAPAPEVDLDFDINSPTPT